ncbi:MAG: hypothetical protein K9G60_13115 [Pseudolabrys sp.]|nr:hypothetical protein [Pseudolabrys sp.]
MERPDFLDRGELARLIPVVADVSKEVRAASILMAALMSVPPFARELFSALGQRVGARAGLTCFTEVRIKNNEDTNLRPDGLIVLDGGRGRVWNCLVEAKIGNAELDANQVEAYLQLAKRNNIQAVITISNQFVALPTHSPLKFSKISLRNVELYHWSWAYLKTTAQLLLHEDEGVFASDDQRYILSEVYRYLDHDSTGANRFDRMNSEWKEIVGMVISGAVLNKSSPIVENTVAAWHQESKDICLLMTERVRRNVNLKLSRAHSGDPQQRLRDDCDVLATKAELSCVLEIPDAANDLVVTANLRSRSICISISVSAPRDRQRATSRINWLSRQLAKAKPDDIYIRCNWPGRAASTQARLSELRANVDAVIGDNDGSLPHSFDIMMIRDIAGKFSGSKTFIEQLEAAVADFYAEIGQYLRAYVPPPPPLKGAEVESVPGSVNVSEKAGAVIGAQPSSEITEESADGSDHQDGGLGADQASLGQRETECVDMPKSGETDIDFSSRQS